MLKNTESRRTPYVKKEEDEEEIDPNEQQQQFSSPEPSSSPPKTNEITKSHSSPQSHLQRHVTLSNIISEGHLEISVHALDRLGVDAEIIKKEKGMKKLGICDTDLIREEELRRYCGVLQRKNSGTNSGPIPKTELVLGFTEEQIHRAKAVKQLGTSEQEIMDDYGRRVSLLGTQEHPTSVN